MAKQGELEYIKNLKDSEVEHAFNKPFSDPECPRYLFDMGTFMHILPPPPARILDLGVGTGWTSIFFALRGYNVTGQDISEDMINLAEKQIDTDSNLHFCVVIMNLRISMKNLIMPCSMTLCTIQLMSLKPCKAFTGL